MTQTSKSEPEAHLSKNVLQMKFMQRSVLRMEREKNEDEYQKIIDDEHWVIDTPQSHKHESKYEKGLGYVFCEELQTGRQSYGGFNVEIEKLMTSTEVERELTVAEEREKKIGVDDEEMTHRYSTLMGVIAKKFAKKRQRGQVGEEGAEDDEEGTHINESTAPSRAKRFRKPKDD